VCKNVAMLAVSSFFCQRSGQRKGCPTKRPKEPALGQASRERQNRTGGGKKGAGWWEWALFHRQQAAQSGRSSFSMEDAC